MAFAETQTSCPELREGRTLKICNRTSNRVANNPWPLESSFAKVRHGPSALVIDGLLSICPRSTDGIGGENRILVLRQCPLANEVLIPPLDKERVGVDLQAEVLLCLCAAQQLRLPRPCVGRALGLIDIHAVHANTHSRLTSRQRFCGVAPMAPSIFVRLPHVEVATPTKNLLQLQRRFQLPAQLLECVLVSLAVLLHDPRKDP
mmetsp:Transcript_33173/g.95392  ORF Transcript_33173/g.95392 Transcript_33173/m.95392 type:complete len:204 (+) Transcript_33173:682-1293(+)